MYDISVLSTFSGILASDSNELCDRIFFVLFNTSQLSRRDELLWFFTRTLDELSIGSVGFKLKPR